MNILDFVNDLRTIDIVILVLVIFIFLFLLVLTSSLIKKNKELRIELTKVNNNDIHDDAIVKEDTQNEEKELVDEEESLYEEDELLEDDIIPEETKKEEDINDILEALPEITETGPYKRNVLRELSARGQTSPVNIGKSTVDVPKVKVTSYLKKEEHKEIPRKQENAKPKRIDEVDNQTFIEEISRRMEDELKPQTIELTEYERKQEEEAIISYRELLKVKDRLYKINDDEEIDTFIDELKEFRTNLEE